MCDYETSWNEKAKVNAGLQSQKKISWLEVSSRKILRPAISTQAFLDFPGS
jgi:hypothetical protein